MTEQDKTLRHSHAAGKLDKVAVAVLHDARADHAGIPRPLDENICNDDVLDADTQQCHHSEHHDLTGKREHHIHHTHDNFFYDAPEITRHDAKNGTQTDGAEHGQQGKAEGRTDAIDHAGKNTAAKLVGAQRILQAVGCKFVQDIGLIGVIGRNDRSQNTYKTHQQHKCNGKHCRAVAEESFFHGQSSLRRRGSETVCKISNSRLNRTNSTPISKT